MGFGNNIKKYRELKGLSVQGLADKMGIGKAGIYKWESEENKPGQDSLTALSKALDVSVDDLLSENGTSDQKPDDNKEKMYSHEEVYRTIVEGHTEYLLVPREVLKETQLVSTEQIKRTWEELAEKNKELAAKNQELERKNIQLDFYQNQFAKLLENLELSPKPPKPKEV
jgi:transcriptional regulator with XRE-family HTH domain